MGGEQLARQRDIGKVVAIGMDLRIEQDRGSCEREALSRAAG
jgi:hypothetical protein